MNTPPIFRFLSYLINNSLAYNKNLGVAATSILFADHARVHYEDRQLLRHLDQEAADKARAEIRAQRGVMAELNYQIRENRNMVVGVSWLTCMGGSLLYTFSKKGLTTTQRIVTARTSFVYHACCCE